jgi:DNA processing protein
MTEQVITLADVPARMRTIHDPPACLYVRHSGVRLNPLPALLARPTVAIVGARACSPYGFAVAQKLAGTLAAEGVVVVSGLARGIDAAAHRAALPFPAATIAVLGCGIDRDYPHVHADLASRIVTSGGLIVSEYEPGTEPAPWRFLARNRIIAGLADVVVVVEARERSGALITVDLAMEAGRPVLAVPGKITSSLSEGTNRLLQLGAAPCLSVADVMDALTRHSVAVPRPAECR